MQILKLLYNKFGVTSLMTNYSKSVFISLKIIVLLSFPQTFGGIGLLAVNIARVVVYQYNSAAGTAFIVTLTLLLLLLCVASLRQSSVFQKVEIIICIILTIFYVVGSIDIIRACWHWLFSNFQLGPFIGSLIASVRKWVEQPYNLQFLFFIPFMTQICSILATLTYAYDTINKFRETGLVSTSNV